MAIIKQIETPTRAIAGYHKITKVEVNAAAQVIEFTVAMYVDEAARGLNLPIWHDYIRIPFDRCVTDLRAIGYAILTAYEGTDFTGAAGDSPAPVSMALELTAPPLVEAKVEVVAEEVVPQPEPAL
jgi:hypothetical protein